jgi:rod shape-determining protein MreD
MTWPNTFLVLAAAVLAIFWQSAFHGLRHLLGAQIDLLPPLMVYAALHCGFATIFALALGGGLLFDSLSANPLGVSVLPLFLSGFLVYSSRELLMREQVFAQAFLGFCGGLAVPAAVLLLMLTMGRPPLFGWGTLWQLLILGLGGAVTAPLWSVLFEWVHLTFAYGRNRQSSFRSDREIRRGRQ